MGFDDVPWLTAQFDATLAAIPDSWRQDGELLTVAGEIAGELELFEKAIDHYRQALGSLTASASLVAIEQLANLLARNAATRATTTGIADDTAVRVGGFTKLGAGTMKLSGANIFSGGTTIAAGTLNLSNSQALQNSSVPNKIQLGVNLTEGLGAGANPDVGQQSAIESISDIEKMLDKFGAISTTKKTLSVTEATIKLKAAYGCLLLLY